MKKKAIALLLAASMALGVTACGSGDTGTTGAAGTEAGGTEAAGTEAAGGETASGEETGEKVLRLYLQDTPATLNGHTMEQDYDLVASLTATLYAVVADPETGMRQYVNMLAEGEPEVSEDYMVWTVKIGEGYTFTDGTPITAETIEYSIKMLNDPKLANRNSNASNFVNGAAYLRGECDWEEVGFKATDEYTLQITFEPGYEPANVTAFKRDWAYAFYGAVHPEMYESCISEDGTSCTYGTNLESFVASGIYEPTSLIEGQYLELHRREDADIYPIAEYFTPDVVTYVVVSDANTLLELFETGELDYVIANQDSYDGYSGAYYLYTPDNYGIYLNSVSPENPILLDVNFRYALYWGLDRETLVEAVHPTSEASALMYYPWATMPDPADPENTVRYYDTEEAKAVRMDGHEITMTGYDKDLALEYFDKAYEANGGQKVTITVKYSDFNENNKNWAEAVTNWYMELFGRDRLELVLQATPSATIYDDLARTNMKYDIMLSCGWYQTVDEPWNNTNWVYSGAFTYNTQYCTISTPELQQQWDELFYSAATGEYRHDDAAKMQICADLEEILYNDCSFIPAFSNGNRYFFSSRITPVTDVGDPDHLWWFLQATFN